MERKMERKEEKRGLVEKEYPLNPDREERRKRTWAKEIS